MPLTTKRFLCFRPIPAYFLTFFVQCRVSAVFYNMTKLTEWIVFAGLAFSIWITLLTDILPLKVSYKAKEVIWPMPVYALIVFGCYSLATIGYRVATFNDCEEASESLKQEIKDAREDLSRKGFKFD